MDPRVKQELTPTGVLRAGINLSNFLLVTGKADNGDPIGVSPDMAREVARRLGVPVAFVTYPSPGALADAAADHAWDIGNIGAEPQRAEKITFTNAYCEIEATYLVPAGSPITALDEVDQPGVRIAVAGRAAYGLWLERNIRHAELIKTDSLDSSFDTFVADRLDVLAGLKPRLLSDVEKLPGARILEGKFSSVQQAIGTPRQNTHAAAWLAGFVEEVKASGFVAELIARHQVAGLSVAPPGS
ncbi:MAG: transporter substrate-binding domain-containing protein [Hyphomicrobiaceae bacterium]